MLVRAFHIQNIRTLVIVNELIKTKFCFLHSQLCRAQRVRPEGARKLRQALPVLEQARHALHVLLLDRRGQRVREARGRPLRGEGPGE